MQDKGQEALRAAFKLADKTLRPKLRKALLPDVVRFADVAMRVDPRDNYTELQLWLNGVPPEIESLGQLLDAVESKKAFVLDVGANCGVYSVPLAKASGAGSVIRAIEPNPLMVGRLGENVLRNDLCAKVRIEAVALGADAGTAELYLKAGNLGQSSLNAESGAKKRGFVVPVRPLRPFLQDLAGYEVSILKIDVEGAEEAALLPWLEAGIAEERPSLLLIETRHAKLWAVDLRGRIEAFGYRPVFEAEGNTLYALPE